MREIDPKVRVDAEGHRYMRPFLGVGADGRAVRPYHRIPDGLSEAEAREEARGWLRRTSPAYAVGATARMGRLMEWHVESLGREGRPANSLRTYRQCVRRAAPLAHMEVADVRPADVRALYDSMLSAGLSVGTVRLEHRFLHSFFRRMAELGARPDNPTDAVRPPRQRPSEMVAVTGEDLRGLEFALVAAIDEDGGGRRGAARRAYALGAWVALVTGLREGEVCGLRRRDLYQTADGRWTLRVAGTVVRTGAGVARQPMTKGRRVRHVAMAMGDALFLRDRAGASASSADSPLVTADGSWCDPDSMARWLKALAMRTGMPYGFTFHSLRHSHATQLLMDGVDVKTVSERLGHSDVAMTLRIYAHVLPGRDGEAADAFRRSLGEGE